MISTLDHIKEKINLYLQTELPAEKAHSKMMVPGRGLYPTIPENSKKAAVLITIYSRQEKIFIALIKRVDHALDRHSGQISFPGGKMEPNDDYPIQTAVREAIEEIGIGDNLEIVGQLSGLYIPVSGYFVIPVVAIHPHSPTFIIEEKEVAQLLEIEMNLLFKEECKSITDIKIGSGLILNSVPCYTIHDTIIWGATAMILAELEWIITQ